VTPEFEIRHERPEDEPGIRRVNELAFGQPDEAMLVDALRAGNAVMLSLVAVREREIVGHILFSAVTVTSPQERYFAVGLAPMAVVPDLQRHGVGSALVRASLEQLARAGHRAIVVVGHPDYYPRFGFVRASSRGIRWEHDVADEAFMVLELVPGALAGRGGVVRYCKEFERL
jgi:putative acetyltransferase